ncbi:PD40 domain-containing protein [Aquimarina sp. MMG016]|uniref:PD40 domain-containing protein n=1 Tax=Aquimarina sp. MMG016 TaxID=2822690 RepID=UPI001B3A764E|nr:PD40 domain-containing protein [Aquimarina sp. MMG016]MBQ4822440.1 PD40 domain-containing protein [Aquimarina sp. MMG016]
MKKIIALLLLTFQITISQETKVTSVLPEIITQFPTVRDFTISPTQDEAYFTAQGYNGELSIIIKVTKKEGKWSSPKVAPFSGQYGDLEAMFSPNGLKLFFVSNRPLDKTKTEPKDQDIWYIERSNNLSEWSEPKNIGSPINTKGDEFYPSIASNGNMYYTSTAAPTKGKDDIFFSEWKNNTYTTPVSLSEAINSKGYEYNAYIAPDESFLIFGGYQRKDGLGSGDLYISRKDENGNWSEAKNLMVTINSNKMDYCPYYDIKTQTLYFTSKRTTIKANSDTRKNLEQLLKTMNSYENGLSRIYSISTKL